MAQSATPISKRLRYLHGTLFCLNLAFAFAVPATDSLVLMAGQHIELAGHGGGEGSLNLLDRILLAINQSFYHWPALTLGSLTADTLLTSLTLVLFGLLLLTLRLIAKTGAIGIVLNQVAGIAALAAVPLSWLLPTSSGMSWMVALYFAVIGGALYLSRKRPNPAWFIILIIHYGFIGWVLYGSRSMGGPSFMWHIVWMWPALLSLVSPCAALVWVLYFMRQRMDLKKQSGN